MKRLLSLCVIGCTCLAPLALAAPAPVVINEVAWAGASDSNDEWIELYNQSETPVDLDGWSITDNTATYLIEASLCLNNDCSIPAGGFFLIEKRESATDLPANLIPATSLGLSNSGELLTLLDAGSNPVDTVDCTGGWFGGDNIAKLTMERRDPAASSSLEASWGNNLPYQARNGLDSAGKEIRGTPAAINSYGDNSPLVQRVIAVSDDAVLLWLTMPVTEASANIGDNYVFQTLAGEVRPTTAARDAGVPTQVLLTGITGIPHGEVVGLTVSNLAMETGKKMGATAVAELVFGVVDIAVARADLDGSHVPDLSEDHPFAFVTVEGRISTLAAFSYNEYLLQDATGGLAVIGDLTGSPLQLGDLVRANGWVDQWFGKDELVLPVEELLGSNLPVPAQVISLADYAADPERYENMLLGIAGVQKDVTSAEWPTTGNSVSLTVNDGGDTLVTLYLSQSTDIDEAMEPAWPLDLIAIGSQYSNMVPPMDGYQIKPRGIADFAVAAWPAGSTRACYTGSAGTQIHAPCQAGSETWDGGAWGGCQGEVTPAEETELSCDSIDNDCDGETDTDIGTETCGVGVCEASTPTCVDGQAQLCVPGDPSETPESSCDDNLDNDCDGLSDADDNDCNLCTEDCDTKFANAAGTCNPATQECEMGECEALFLDCANGDSDGCETALHSDTACNSCDENCMQAFPHAAGSCIEDTGVFACVLAGCAPGWGDCLAGEGASAGCETDTTANSDHCAGCNSPCDPGATCLNSVCSTACADADQDNFADLACGGKDCNDQDPAIHPEAAELCDAVDNNCDGFTDESFATLGDACDGPDSDVCELGTLVCNAAKDGVACNETESRTEACNGQDDDCDGDIDEDFTVGQACDRDDDPDQCAEGLIACNQAGNGVVCIEEGPGHPEICDGLDNDCDGATDEELGTFDCGAGACYVVVDACKNGVPVTCRPHDKPEELELSCDDGIDNDCDGLTDGADLTSCKKPGTAETSCGCGQNQNPQSALLLLGLLSLLMIKRRKVPRPY